MSAKKAVSRNSLNQRKPVEQRAEKLHHIEHSPEATFPLTDKTIRVLQNMLNHRLGMAAMKPNHYWMAEIASLTVAIAELSELLKAREESAIEVVS